MVNVLGLTFAVLAALALGVTSIFVRLGSRSGKSNEIVIVTFIANLTFVVPITLYWYYPNFGLTPRAIVAFAMAGTMGTFFGRALFYKSIETIGASRTEPIKATQPLHAAVIAALVLGEALTATNLFGILLLIGGLALVSREIVNDDDVGGSDNVSPALLVVPLGAAFFFGIEPIFAKIGFEEDTPILVALVVKTVAGLTAMTLYLRVRNNFPSFSLRSTEPVVLKWYALAGISNTIFLTSYYAALETAPVILVVPLVQTSPLVVVVLSLLFLSHLERVTPRLIAAATIVVVGATVVSLTT
ncbi:DMT family transporter [Natrarchaeobius halalkaliphilus]|uniref:DMT family transporter n=1 Tax=Natrarchaeobius halalkaliphilus TaxID=1679091 RepID=A0A3N6LYY2_9EURY|nr:EamA family transporter [Natrarchaeobius halalkaliphilus]RQG87913.1 DMT family transporter [Natrarchaeobius halalkaliphilus]